MREAQRVWEKHEQPLELLTILEQNFVKDQDGTGDVPDPKKEADLEQIRHRALMKEFRQYLDSKGKLKIVRTEALRAGFKECWQEGDYDDHHPDGEASPRGGDPGRSSPPHVLRQRPDEERRMILPT